MLQVGEAPVLTEEGKEMLLACLHELLIDDKVGVEEEAAEVGAVGEEGGEDGVRILLAELAQVENDLLEGPGTGKVRGVELRLDRGIGRELEGLEGGKLGEVGEDEGADVGVDVDVGEGVSQGLSNGPPDVGEEGTAGVLRKLNEVIESSALKEGEEREAAENRLPDRLGLKRAQVQRILLIEERIFGGGKKSFRAGKLELSESMLRKGGEEANEVHQRELARAEQPQGLEAGKSGGN